MWQKLLNLYKETPMDNQEVFHMLFAVKDDLPLKDCSSQAKVLFSPAVLYLKKDCHAVCSL
jgi:hypothetical protein